MKRKGIGPSDITTLFGGITKLRGWIICKNCGYPMAPYQYAIRSHKKVCGKIRKGFHRFNCKKVYIDKAEYFIFYDKGMIHYMSYGGIAKYIGEITETVKGRIKRGWNIEQILGKESPPPIKRQGRYGSMPTRKERKERSQLSEKETNIQKLLRGF